MPEFKKPNTIKVTVGLVLPRQESAVAMHQESEGAVEQGNELQELVCTTTDVR
jgi:hypothetical protein